MRTGMSRKAGKHRALGVAGQMEEAVPRQQRVKLLTQRQGAHIRHRPLLMRKILAAAGNHRRRGIDAGQPVPPADKVGRDRRSVAAANIENMAAGSHPRKKRIQPGLFKQVG